MSKRPPFDGQALRDSLTELARAHQGNELALRQQALSTVKATLDQARREIQDQFEAGHLHGDQCAEALALIIDELLCVLADFTRIHVLRLANPTEAERVTILAVGGFGRGKLAPYSDVDLLFLLPYKRNPANEQFVEYILYMLWDLGLKVGHATRTLADCMVQAKADMTVRTSMLDPRLIWGDEELYTAFTTLYETKIRRGSARPFVAAKLAERDVRHAQTGQSRYLVEPNLKEGKGGLRDLDTLFWLAKYCYGISHIDELVSRGILQSTERQMFRRCERFLWTVRCHLHFMSNRAEERLSFDVQTELAARLSIQATRGLNAVERFMRAYFLVAKNVGDLTSVICASLEEEQTKKGRVARLPALFRRQKHVHGFIIETGRLMYKQRDIFERDPVNLIRLFQLADRFGLDIHPDTMRLVGQSLRLIDRQLQKSEEANALFLEILTSRKTPERSLRRMNEAGVLGRFIPDFGKIVALMQFNMYHHYTADEHLIRAIGILSEIDTGRRDADQPHIVSVLNKDLNRKVLFLSVLLHDIAKGRPEDHSVAGARIARRLGPRLGFSPEETALTEWLVANHLHMSDVAQRRDLSDPRTIDDFVSFVQTTEHLRHLYVLTAVDIQAVGPGTWNGWKAQLLRELYDETESVLTGGASLANRQTRIAEAHAAFTARLPHVSPEHLAHYVQRHRPSYWLNVDLDTQCRHYDLLAQAHDEPMVIDFVYDDARDVTILTFVSPDHPGLFARLSGACAIAGVSILDARISTTLDGMALDSLLIRDIDMSGEMPRTRQERIRTVIQTVLRGEILAPDNLAPPRDGRRLRAFQLVPRVQIDNALSDQATVIEVSGLDQPGLLHALSRTLFNMNVSIIAARVATWGERAVDVFYVTDLFGQKITSSSRLQTISKKLKEAMADPAQAARPKARRSEVA